MKLLIEKICIILIVLLHVIIFAACNNTIEDTMYDKKTERFVETTEEIPLDLPGDEIITESRWNSGYFGTARWTK